jgi:hypothetical protein
MTQVLAEVGLRASVLARGRFKEAQGLAGYRFKDLQGVGLRG